MSDTNALAKLEELTLRQGAIPIIYFDNSLYHIEVPFSHYSGAGFTLAEAIENARDKP